MSLQAIESVMIDCIFDLRYAGPNNITGKILYDGTVKAMLAPQALGAFSRAAQNIKDRGLKLVVWDAYRPNEVQEQLRAVCSDDHYVAVDSNHCKGLAVDVTLADSSGTYLDMGTDHDEFSEKSHSTYAALSPEQLANRALLHDVMSEVGFKQLPYEWWHFDYVGGDDV